MNETKTLDVAAILESHGRTYDPFTMEVIKNALASIADEMALTVARTARSFVIKEALDYSTALFAADGQLIAQGTCLPLHMGSMPDAIAAVTRAYGDEINTGDVYIVNDPYGGSTHLPDIVIVKPIFDGDAFVGYSACLAHMTDIGGRVPGGNASDSTELYQEGLRLPVGRLYEAGKENDFIFRLIACNVRVPDKVLGDIRSQISACIIGERELLKLVEKYGLERFQTYCDALLDYTEAFTRSEIAKLPDGSYDFVDHLDGDGIEPGAIRFEVNVTVHGDDMTIDFTGTSPQVKGAINSVWAFTYSASLACVRSILDLGIPNNAGYFRPIHLVAPEGTIVNPRPPAPVAARGLTAVRIADTVFGALAKLAPDRVPASGSSAPDIGVTFGGYHADGTPFVYLEFLVGSWGGGPHRDGMDGCTGTVVNYSNTPAELLETDQPLAIERYGFVTDSGGAGRFRGGLGIEKHIRFLADEAVLQIRSDRRDFAPYGLEGGAPGLGADSGLVRADGEEEAFPSKFLTTVRKGDLFRVRIPSGGGFGNAMEREPEAVLSDVVDGKVTARRAEADYGVVIRGDPPMLCEAETQALRARRDGERGERSV